MTSGLTTIPVKGAASFIWGVLNKTNPLRLQIYKIKERTRRPSMRHWMRYCYPLGRVTSTAFRASQRKLVSLKDVRENGYTLPTQDAQ